MLAEPSNLHEVIDLTNIDDVDFLSPLQYPVMPIPNISQHTYPQATYLWKDLLVLKEMSKDCLIVEFPALVPEPEFPLLIVQAPGEKLAVWGAHHRADTQERAQISAEWEMALNAQEEQLLDWKHFQSTYEQIENGQIKEWLQEQQEAEEQECGEGCKGES
uniref:Uncharacterized protein n=1 Tax=Moniliophthora roreri TaxID=221103 RepID=A0A0W0F9J3_MONRR